MDENEDWLWQDPDMQELCTVQMRTLSELLARQATDRLRLAIKIRKERTDASQ